MQEKVKTTEEIFETIMDILNYHIYEGKVINNLKKLICDYGNCQLNEYIVLQHEFHEGKAGNPVWTASLCK